MPEKYRILIVDDISETRENISKLLQFEDDIEVVGEFGSGREALEATKSLDPDVILMDINMPDMDGISATEMIRKSSPVPQIVILSVQGDTTYMRRAMLAGARDYLTKPPVTEDLVAAIRRAGEMARIERAKLDEHANALRGALAAVAAPKRKSGKVIVVYSPKGGTGVTTLAVNLGVVLQSEETPTILVDANFQFGSIPLFLNETSKTTIVDLTSRADQLDAEFIHEVVSEHKEIGIAFLQAPLRIEQAEEITGEQYSAVLGALREQYDYVVVDAPRAVNDILLVSLDAADMILVVLTQDIPAIQNTRIVLDLFNTLKVPRSKIQLVMNRYDKRISITPERVGESLKMPITVSIPLDDKIVLTSVNRGIPFMRNPTAEPICQTIQKMAATMVENLDKKE